MLMTYCDAAAAAERGGRVVGPRVGAAHREDRHERQRRHLLRLVLEDDLDRAVGELFEVDGLLVGVHAPGRGLVEHLLERDVGDRRHELDERRERRFAIGAISAACASASPPSRHHGERERRAEVQFLGNERRGRRAEPGEEHAAVVGEAYDELAREPEQVAAVRRGARRTARGAPAGRPGAARTRTRSRRRSCRRRRGSPRTDPGSRPRTPRRTRPSAVTTSAPTRLSTVRPASATASRCRRRASARRRRCC